MSCFKNKCREYSELITWQMNTDIQTLEETSNQVRVLGSRDGESFDQAFDAVIVANGARSLLRSKEWVKVDQAYP